jgi:hypothetical protein
LLLLVVVVSVVFVMEVVVVVVVEHNASRVGVGVYTVPNFLFFVSSFVRLPALMSAFAAGERRTRRRLLAHACRRSRPIRRGPRGACMRRAQAAPLTLID